MDCSMPGLPIDHQLLEFTQTLIHWVGDAIQPPPSSVVPFSSRLQSFQASGSFPMSQFYASGGQSIGVSASTSVLPVNTQDWSPLGWTARRSNQSILMEISPNIHWKDWCWRWNSNTLATWCIELTHWKRPCCWERLKAGGEGDNRRWDVQMA